MAVDLRALVRDTLATSRAADPYAVADEVLAAVPAGGLREALAQCLPGLVRDEIRRSRTAAMPTVPGPVPRLAALPAARGGRSVKVAAIRAASPRWLEERLNTGPAPRDWKRLGDCTAADLLFAAGQRRRQAARTAAAADRLEALAQLLQEHAAPRVRDLPVQILTPLETAA